MGKVDQLNDAVDHCVSKGDEGVYTSPGKPSEKELHKVFEIHENLLCRSKALFSDGFFYKVRGRSRRGSVHNEQ
jgi:hypothetical protein